MNRGVALLRILLFLSVTAGVSVAALELREPRQSEAAGAVLIFPSVSCGDGGAQVTYEWQPVSGALEQRIEISTSDNGFAPGTFSSTELSAGAASHTATASDPHWPHFWRINTRTAAGWQVSLSSSFTPCDWPVLLVGGVYCQTPTQARADLRWAPRADVVGYQWLEISLDGSFTDAGMVRIGPLAFVAQDYTRGGFVVGQQYAFRVVWEDSEGNRVPTQVGWFVPVCTSTSTSSELYSSPDRLLVPRLGIDAPVNVRDVGFGGELGVPAGAYDVVRYNFGDLSGLGGYPGQGGVTMIGGHVDYYVVGLAVFAPLRQAQAGDRIEYVLADGSRVAYIVDWISDLPWDTNLTGYLTHRTSDELILVTCNGTFDQAARRYDMRRLVHAVRTY